MERVAHFDIFSGVEPSAITSAMTGAVVKQYKHREYLYRAGDPATSFHIILEGAVKLIRHSPKGDDVIVHFAVQGDVIGALLMNQLNDVPFPISAKSMGPTRTAKIPKATFQRFWQSNVTLQSRLNTILYHRMSNIQDDKMMSSSPLRARIANLLLRHLDQESGDQTQQLSLALTRQEIADSLGVAVESVIRAMRAWQEDGTIIRALERGPEVVNIEKLMRNLQN